METTNKRRDFLKTAMLGLVAVPAAMSVLGSRAWAQAAKLVDAATDPVAKALKYVADASKAPERKTAKQGTAPDKQFCDNCSLYTKQADVGGKAAGKCTMIQGGLVEAKGWCTSWAKKG